MVKIKDEMSWMKLCETVVDVQQNPWQSGSTCSCGEHMSSTRSLHASQAFGTSTFTMTLGRAGDAGRAQMKPTNHKRPEAMRDGPVAILRQKDIKGQCLWTNGSSAESMDLNIRETAVAPSGWTI